MSTKYVVIAGGAVVLGLFFFVLTSGEGSSTVGEYEHDEHASVELVAKDPVRADGEFTVTTSFYPLAFAAERVGGDLVVVQNIGSGRDPHDFEPSTQDVVALQSADLVVLQGVDFEPWGEAVQAQLVDEEVPVLLATDGLELQEGGHHHEDEHATAGSEHGEDHEHEEESDHEHETSHEEEHEHEHGAYDPHTWLDPVLMDETVERLTTALATLDPENATTYQANAAVLRTELAELDTEYANTLGQCELAEVITSHDAFGYVGARYDFTIHSIAGLSTQDTPSAVTLAELREEAEEGVGAILLEESSVTAYGETLSRETGLTTLSVNPIAYLVPEGEDYFSLMRANLEVFSQALSCNG